ncbi:MAG: hemerythrin domain-containing protein [Burkholderiaceae bacterium]
MSSAFLEPAPGFDQPIALLKHCHDRMRRQIGTMQRLVPHLQKHGADLEAQQAASAVLRYFSEAAPNHHADEEVDLLPALREVADGDDADTLRRLEPEILREHQQMDVLWNMLRPALAAIAAGENQPLPETALGPFSEMYLAHMVKEETVIAPMARRLLNPARIAQIGDAMRARRGITA